MWSSLHVYYENPDPLLSHCIKPLVASLRERELIGRFFFLRYWQRGFHVRLRFHSADSQRRELAAAELGAGLTRFMAESPTARRLSDAEYAAVLAQFAEREGVACGTDIAPPNSLSVESYEPEYAKYGGAEGVAIAEALFSSSSEVALGLLSSFEARASARHSAALLAMLSAVQQFSMPRQTMISFFEHYGNVWQAYSPELTNQSERALQACAERVAPQARCILDGEESKSPALRIWAAATREAARAICARPDVLAQVDAPRSDSDARKAWLLVQYLHTHANRLGLIPSDEAHLARLAARTIQVLS